jgi:hypothetical protein
MDAERLQPLDLASWLTPVSSNCIEKPLFLGAKEQVPCRLVASRVPASIMNERRRSAKKKAKKKGDTPSKAHLALLAWNLFSTNVPHTIWKAAAVLKVYPLRWQIALIFKSWKSYLLVWCTVGLDTVWGIVPYRRCLEAYTRDCHRGPRARSSQSDWRGEQAWVAEARAVFRTAQD